MCLFMEVSYALHLFMNEILLTSQELCYDAKLESIMG